MIFRPVVRHSRARNRVKVSFRNSKRRIERFPCFFGPPKLTEGSRIHRIGPGKL